MDIAWGIEVLAKKDFFSGERPLRLIDHPMENQSSEDSNSIKDNVAKPKRISARGRNPGMEWKCKRSTTTGQPRQERRSKGRTDALKDVMGVEGSFKHEWDFLYKKWREDWRHYGSCCWRLVD